MLKLPATVFILTSHKSKSIITAKTNTENIKSASPGQARSRMRNPNHLILLLEVIER